MTRVTLQSEVLVSKFLGLVAYLAGFTVAVTTAVAENDSVLTLGVIHHDGAARAAQFRPMADYVAAGLAAHGVSGVAIEVVADRRALARMMREGSVDWVSENPANAIFLQETAGAQILARKWKQGPPQYRSVFFARADSGIGGLDDLPGRIVAFVRPDSTAGHLLPAAALIRGGYRAVALDTPRHRPPVGTIGYAFSGSEFNSTTWVHKGIVDAGVISNIDWDSADRLPTNFRQDFRIFHQTESLPRALELVRGSLDMSLREALRQLLLGMGSDARAAGALRAYQGTTRFDELDDDDYETMRKLRRTFAQLMLVH